MRASADLFDLFWENSKLNVRTGQGFFRRIEEHARVAVPAPSSLQYPAPDLPLPRPRDGLARAMSRRRSVRGFSARPASLRQLGGLFAAFAGTRYGGRTFASAGGTYPLEAYCLVDRADGGLDRSAVYYNHDNHSLARIGELPEWSEYADAVNLELTGAPPALLFVFVLFPDRTTPKYGERGGRFQLIEVGHASQNLALRIVREGMVGCEVGGLYDDRIKELLRLTGTTARIALGYACGHPA